MDLSHLDKKYFIDPHKYNCPFCKRNHVSYDLIFTEDFDWSENKKCYIYFVKCNSCEKISLHFSYNDIRKRVFSHIYDKTGHPENEFKEKIEIDDKIFFSQPSSSFTLDNRYPKRIRELIFEAEKSRQANYLVGSSACLRKAIYELLRYEKVRVFSQKTRKVKYQKSIEKLGKKFNFVPEELFIALSNIQGLASDNMHEGSWKAWDSRNIKILIELTKSILNEMYIVPDERKKGLGIITEIKCKFTNDKKIKK